MGLGVVIVVGAEDDCDSDATGICDALVQTVESAVVVYSSLLGAGIGALIGTLVKTGRWVPGFVPQTSQEGNPGLSLTWSLPTRW